MANILGRKTTKAASSWSLQLLNTKVQSSNSKGGSLNERCENLNLKFCISMNTIHWIDSGQRLPDQKDDKKLWIMIKWFIEFLNFDQLERTTKHLMSLINWKWRILMIEWIIYMSRLDTSRQSTRWKNKAPYYEERLRDAICCE